MKQRLQLLHYVLFLCIVLPRSLGAGGEGGVSPLQFEDVRRGIVHTPALQHPRIEYLSQFNSKLRLLRELFQSPMGRYDLFDPSSNTENHLRLHGVTDSAQLAWVSNYSSGLQPSIDHATAIAVDGAGNVYVTGRSTGTGTFSDYATVKYSPSGTQLWVARYNGPGNNTDEPAAITVDDSGYVYVTGASWGTSSLSDYATIKYNPEGVELWVARYNGAGNGDDRAYAIAVDAFGNVYVTGESWNGSGPGVDYATVKYNAAGVQQWAIVYNSLGNRTDRGRAIAVDGMGNVYVTGESGTPNQGLDYATVKYNAAGAVLWVSRYNGPAGGDDEARAIALDASGNVYVTGGSVGSGSGADYLTVKYSSIGSELWTARYNGPGNSTDFALRLAVDAGGNVVVTGRSWGITSDYDYATLKYSTAGAQQWVSRYNGPGNGIDIATAIAVNPAGDVYVTGRSAGSGTGSDYATIKYGAGGAELWVARYDGPASGEDHGVALALDGAGSVYVTGRSYSSIASDDFATVKYNAQGVQQWLVRYNGPGSSDDAATALAVDAVGNVYVTGRSAGSGTGYDYATVKYNASGQQLWASRYNGPGNSDDIPFDIALDADGNVYVTGGSFGSGTAIDYATVKYNANGQQQWVARYNNTGNGNDAAIALALDANANVYVTGASVGVTGLLDYATVKYNANGEEQWVRRFVGPGNGDDFAVDIAVGSGSAIYVTGTTTGLSGYFDISTINYDDQGNVLWVETYDTPMNDDDIATAVALDAGGNVLVIGSSWGIQFDYVTMKYSPGGNRLWVSRYNGPANSDDIAAAVVVDGGGNVYVTGGSYGGATQHDYATVKYSSTGDQLWVARYDGGFGRSDLATSIAVDVSSNVYVTGESSNATPNVGIVTLKYDQSGQQQWMTRYDGPEMTSDFGRAVRVGTGGEVYVAGVSIGSGRSIYTAIKYIQVSVSVRERDDLPLDHQLSQNYPNPFNSGTQIDFSLHVAGFTSLKVYDLVGREVATLVHDELKPGRYQVTWDASGMASGVYLYRLESAATARSRRMLLLR